MPKCDGLKIMWIGKSAAKPRTGEGSTTIPQGSTSQAIGDGSGRHPFWMMIWSILIGNL